MRSPITPSGQREDFATAAGDEDGVLELRRQASILRDNGPPVVPYVVVIRAEGDHGLNREGHACIHDGVVAGVVVVGDNETAMECGADPVSCEVTHDAVVEALGETFDDSSDEGK